MSFIAKVAAAARGRFHRAWLPSFCTPVVLVHTYPCFDSINESGAVEAELSVGLRKGSPVPDHARWEC